jgi:hypothetical protein
MYALEYIINIKKENFINFPLIKEFDDDYSDNEITSILLKKGWVSCYRYEFEDSKYDYYSDEE